MSTVLQQDQKKIVAQISQEISQVSSDSYYSNTLDNDKRVDLANLEKLLLLLEKCYYLTPAEDKPEFEDLGKLLLTKCSQLASVEDKPEVDDLEEVLKVLQEKQDYETLNSVLKKIYSFVDLFIRLNVIKESKNFRNTIERLIRRSLLKESNIDFESKEYRQSYKASLQWLSVNGNEEDLALIQKVRQNPPFSSEEILRVFDIAEQDIIKRLKNSFQLIGYSHPFDEYPAPIVPIGYHKGELVAVYLDPSDTSDIFLSLDQEHHYIKFDNQKIKALEQFNYLQHKLFAFSEDDIRLYRVSEEKEFYRDILKDKDLSQENPFLRYSLAKTTEDIEVIQEELIRCIKYLSTHSQGMIHNWYEAEKEKISDLWQKNQLDFPSEEYFKALASK